MNWDNQNKDPWGNKNDAPDFDELIKKFSSILGRKKSPSNGSGGDNKGGGFKFSSSRIFSYGFFAFLFLEGFFKFKKKRLGEQPFMSLFYFLLVLDVFVLLV